MSKLSQTTTHPGNEFEPGDFHFGFRHAMTLEEAEDAFRCNGDYMWSQKQADHLTQLLDKLTQVLASNPSDTFRRDVQTGRNRDVWKQLRERWGYTLRQAGDELGVEPSTISRYENGQRRPDSAIYGRWLEKLWGQEVALWRTHVFLEAMVRDAWPPDEWQGRDEITEQWARLYGDDGYYSQWVETGVLPNTNHWGERFDGIMELRAEQHKKAGIPVAA